MPLTEVTKLTILAAFFFSFGTQLMNCYQHITTPIGQLKLVANKNSLIAILWENDDPLRVKLGPMEKELQHPVLIETSKQLNAYFSGNLNPFSINLDFQGTDFQKAVWTALLTIPYGQTRSYAEIAQQIGHPKAVRAVGAANGKNPISIIAPCHRVIGSNGKLTGFAGGLAQKAYLLALENERGEVYR